MTRSKSIMSVARLGLVVSLAVGTAAAQSTQDAARAAAESWMRLVDGAQYAQSWQAAGSFFRNAVPQERWAEAAKSAREPLGSLKSRVVKSSTATKTLPGAPDGDYVVMQFNTAFEKKAAAVETITVVREPDNQWRVVGYFVK